MKMELRQWQSTFLCDKHLEITAESWNHEDTFGEQTYRKQHCDMVKINLTKPGCEEIEICAPGFPVICSSLPSKVDVTQYPHLDNLEFADDGQRYVIGLPWKERDLC